MLQQYAHFSDLQKIIEDHYGKTGRRIDYPEACRMAVDAGLTTDHYQPLRHTVLEKKPTEEYFLELMANRQLPALYATKERPLVEEGMVFPDHYGVYVVQQFRNIGSGMHAHDYFEVDYVFKGSAQLIFEGEELTLQEGEVCVLAPNSRHRLEIPDPNSVVLLLLMRRSTFDQTFFSLLSRNDLLACFFRTMLYGERSANYLTFHTDNANPVKYHMISIALNIMIDDACSNACAAGLVTVLFSTMLRRYSSSIRFYDSNLHMEMPLVLQYIQHNYQHLTLSDLAKVFHYNESHLSVLIKKDTGYTYTELITHLRMTDAASYLLNTPMKIAEIAEMIGYHSADHFSRTFRNYYKVSPLQFRDERGKTAETNALF